MANVHASPSSCHENDNLICETDSHKAWGLDPIQALGFSSCLTGLPPSMFVLRPLTGWAKFYGSSWAQ